MSENNKSFPIFFPSHLLQEKTTTKLNKNNNILNKNILNKNNNNNILNKNNNNNNNILNKNNNISSDSKYFSNNYKRPLFRFKL